MQRIPQTADGCPHKEQCKLYGSGINNNDAHLESKHTGSDLSQRKKNENCSMPAARESIEWSHAKI